MFVVCGCVVCVLLCVSLCCFNVFSFRVLFVVAGVGFVVFCVCLLFLFVMFIVCGCVCCSIVCVVCRFV